MTDTRDPDSNDEQWGPTQDLPVRRAPVSASELLKLPQRLGRYLLVERLGAGGMAEVFLATQDGPAGFTKRVVVKRIHSHLARDNRFVEMFKREALLVAKLNHQNVVQVYELGEDESIYFIAMEHIDGLPLSRLARRAWRNGRSVPMEVILGAVADAALGLHHAHELTDDDGRRIGVIHRDVSPENLMINKDGTTKVLDFGIARGADTTGLTKTGEIKGKVPFMSPEQIRGDDLDARSDLYSLGVTLYWLLTGRLPLSANSELMLLNVVLTEKPEPPSSSNPHVPAFLDDLCLALLQKLPKDRPASGLAVYEALAPLAPVRTQLAAPYVAEVLALPEAAGDVDVVTDGFVPAIPQTDVFTRGWLPSTPRTMSPQEQVAFLAEPPVRRPSLPALALGGLVALLTVGAAGVWATTGEDPPPLPEPPPLDAHEPAVEPPRPGGSDTTPEQDDDAPPPEEPPEELAEADEPEEQRSQQRLRRVDAKAPKQIRWLSPRGKLLGKGDGPLHVPAGSRYVVAYDPARDARIKVPLEGNTVDLSRAPVGQLDVRAFPFAEVFLGKERLGMTPFTPQQVPAGRYRVKLRYDGRERVKTVTVKKGGVTRVKVDFREE